jgi:DNA uptake protein ComE-like DNA-binding protein
MKAAISLLFSVCLIAPVMGQTNDATTEPLAETSALDTPENIAAAQATVSALNDLLLLNQRAKFARFLRTQSRFAHMADKQTLLYVKAEADRPNYGGNAAAKTHSNLWLSILQGKVKPAPSTQATPTD